MAALSPRWRQPALLVAAVGAFLALGAVWLWRFRRGHPVDIDEAGYLSIAIVDYRGLVEGGPGGYWDAVMLPTIQAPLMTALTGPVFTVTGTGILSGLLVPLLLGGVMLGASFALGRDTAGRYAGWVTLALVAAAPVVIGYSRSYNFAIASGAAAALLLWAVVRSSGFEHLGWCAAVGAAAGLLALSRTYALALLPALALMALLALIAGPRRGRSLAGSTLAALVAVVVAGPWYHRNGEAVWDHLLSYGYGSARAEYGSSESVVSLESWRRSVAYFLENVGLPLGVLLLAGVCLAIAAVVMAIRRSGIGATARACLRSPVLPAAVWVAWGLTILTTTGNKGSGFAAPLVPGCAVVTAWGCARLPPRARLVAAVLVTLVLAVNTVATTFPRSDVAGPVSAELPWLGDVPVIDGQPLMQRYIRAGQRPGRTGQLTPQQARHWLAATRKVSDVLATQPPEVALFGFRHRLVNPNSVQLEALLADGDPLFTGFISPIDVPNDLSAMNRWLTVDVPNACTLLTARGEVFEFEPVVDAMLLERAAHGSGFRRTSTIPMPDGRTIVVWRRPATCPATDGTADGA